MRANFVASVCLVSLALAGVAQAQQQSQPTPPHAPTNPPPEVIAPRSNTTDNASTGVIQPPNVDPGISVKPPADAPQSMPVIPPPGSPGNNPNVVPK